MHAGSRVDSPHWSPGMVQSSDACFSEGTPRSTLAGTMKKRSLKSGAADILCDTRSLRRRPCRKNVTCAQYPLCPRQPAFEPAVVSLKENDAPSRTIPLSS